MVEWMTCVQPRNGLIKNADPEKLMSKCLILKEGSLENDFDQLITFSYK